MEIKELYTSAGASLQLMPMIMELVAPIKSQRLYLIVGTSCKLAPAGGNLLRLRKLANNILIIDSNF